MLFVRIVTLAFSLIWAFMFIMCGTRHLFIPAVVCAVCCAFNVALYNKFTRKP